MCVDLLVPSPVKFIEELTQLEHYDWDDDDSQQRGSAAEILEMYNISPPIARSMCIPWKLVTEDVTTK
jgi:hypothetical protein